MPWVASEACWRNTESPAILQMSMGMVRRWPGGLWVLAFEQVDFVLESGGSKTDVKLTSEDRVHDRDVLVREVAGDGEDEDSRVQRCGLD